MPKPDPIAVAAPGKIALLTQRESQLESALKKAQALPAVMGDAKDRKDKLIETIEYEIQVVQWEKSLREQYLALSQDSANDKEPGFFTRPSIKSAWKDREKARAKDRAKLAADIADLPNQYPESYPKTDVAQPCIKCHTDDIAKEVKRVNKLAKVEILHGFTAGDATGRTDPVLAAEATQWVNLNEYRKRYERKDLPGWLSPGFGGKAVDNFDRLSRKVRVRLTFTNPGVERYEVKWIQSGGDAGYSVTEAAAHYGYRVTPSDSTTFEGNWGFGHTDADGVAIVDLNIRAAGGETWKIKGHDDYGTEITAAGSLKTRRGLFVTTMTMDKVTSVPLDATKAEFLKHEIYLETDELTYGTAGKLPFRKFVFADEHRIDAQINDLNAAAKTVFNDSTYRGEATATLEPYLIVAAYYNQSPAFSTNPYRKSGTPRSKMKIPLDYYLWTKDDPDNSWLVSATVETKDADGKVKKDWPAPVIGDFELPVEPCAEITFKPSKEMLKQKRLTIKVTVRSFSGGINGFSSGAQAEGSLIASARMGLTAARSTADMNQTLVHELGHKMNMTTGPEPPAAPLPPGTAAPANLNYYLFLDASPLNYVARGHMGNHCYHDAIPEAGGPAATALQPDFGIYEGSCVMFGSQNKRSTTAFCPDCAKRMKKANLEWGWVRP